MSTDLDLRRSSSETHFPPIKTSNPQSSDDSNSCVIQTELDIEINDEECRTPTMPDNKIPAILSCPPAPRKPKAVASCKRKLDFFEIAGREEIESFFRSSGVMKKRRCPCT